MAHSFDMSTINYPASCSWIFIFIGPASWTTVTGLYVYNNLEFFSSQHPQYCSTVDNLATAHPDLDSRGEIEEIEESRL
jgi:hypothetical protein